MGKLVLGVGINDADYVVQPTINGKQIICPYYRKWFDMLKRCYYKQFLAKYPTYTGCEVAEEWKTFSNFKAWMETQDWEGKQLDKDVLVPNNQLYSKAACCFVSQNVNSFLTDSNASRGKHMIGVTLDTRAKKFRAHCNDGNGKFIYLGFFDNELEAHLAWKAYKHKLACKLAGEQSDPRVAEALRKRFA